MFHHYESPLKYERVNVFDENIGRHVYRTNVYPEISIADVKETYLSGSVALIDAPFQT